MIKIQYKKVEPFRIAGKWDIQSRRLKKELLQLKETGRKFRMVPDDEMLTRAEAGLSKKRENVIQTVFPEKA